MKIVDWMFLRWLHCKPNSAHVPLYCYSILSKRMTKVLSLFCKYSIIRPVLKTVFLSLYFWYLVLLWCIALIFKPLPSTTLEPLILVQHSHSSHAFPEEFSSSSQWGYSQCHGTHTACPFTSFVIRTATSFLLLWYCPSLHWMFKSTWKSLRSQSKSCDCGINDFYHSGLALSNKRGMG